MGFLAGRTEEGAWFLLVFAAIIFMIEQENFSIGKALIDTTLRRHAEIRRQVNAKEAPPEFLGRQRREHLQLARLELFADGPRRA